MRVCLSGVGPDVEIDEAFVRGTLRERAEEVRLSRFVFPDANWKLETQVLLRESLRLNSFVIVTVTFLNAEVDTGGWLFDDDAKNYFPFHEGRITVTLVARTNESASANARTVCRITTGHSTTPHKVLVTPIQAKRIAAPML